MPKNQKTKIKGCCHFLRRQLRRQLTDNTASRKEGIFRWQNAVKTYIRERTDGGKGGISKDAGLIGGWSTVMCMPENTATAKRSLTRPKQDTGMCGIR